MAKKDNAPKKTVYLDSCIFLDYINKTEDWETIQAILDYASKGHIRIITSILTIAEVAYGAEELKGGPLSAAALNKIEGLWNPSSSPVVLIEVFPHLCYLARDLVRKARSNGKSLHGPDAIHLATAIHFKAIEAHTTDHKMLKCNKVFGIAIFRPNSGVLATDEPNGVLFDKNDGLTPPPLNLSDAADEPPLELPPPGESPGTP